jgi:hypothetical protein
MEGVKEQGRWKAGSICTCQDLPSCLPQVQQRPSLTSRNASSHIRLHISSHSGSNHTQMDPILPRNSARTSVEYVFIYHANAYTVVLSKPHHPIISAEPLTSKQAVPMQIQVNLAHHTSASRCAPRSQHPPSKFQPPSSTPQKPTPPTLPNPITNRLLAKLHTQILPPPTMQLDIPQSVQSHIYMKIPNTLK